MIFHSLDFLVFVVITLAAYWSLPLRGQNVLLLVASYVFYGWVHPWFLGLIFATTFIDYWSARSMAQRPEHKQAWLWLSIITNFGMLGFFKYFGFFAANLAGVAASVGWHVPQAAFEILLPVGISFYTFQSMSYTIDVYRNHAPARTSFVDMAGFVSFFPHLVAGPIMRATNLLPQFERERLLSATAARDATVLIVWGFFKKLVIADNVGVIANKVFTLESPEFPVLWAGVFAFAIQNHADFSAYTDIARGVADLPGNRPRTTDASPATNADRWQRSSCSAARPPSTSSTSRSDLSPFAPFVPTAPRRRARRAAACQGCRSASPAIPAASPQPTVGSGLDASSATAPPIHSPPGLAASVARETDRH